MTTTKDRKETAIVQRKEIDSLVPDTKNQADLAKILLDSGMWPNLKDKGVAGVFAIIEYGRELGIPPVAALNTMAIVSGRLTMEAKALLAVAHDRAGVTWKIETLTSKGCILIFSRPGFESVKSSFDETDAKAANLLGKDNWRNYPKDMYFARAASRGVRQIAPDAVLGLYVIEEMQDVILPATGEVIEAKVVEKKAEEKPKEEPKPELTELDNVKAQVFKLLETLVKDYNKEPGELIEKIKGRILNVFKHVVERVPEDLTEKEAAVILNALTNTINAEEAARKEEKEKEGAF